jgi:hypothetical protein
MRALVDLLAKLGSNSPFTLLSLFHKDGTLANLGTVEGITAAGGFNGIAAN